MTCPKCHNEAEGKWCRFCGSRIETDDIDISAYSYQQNINKSNTRQGQHSKSRRRSPNQNTGRSPLGAILVIFVLMIVLVSLILSIVFSKPEKKKTVSKKITASSAEKKEASGEELTDKAERYMEIGDYESAEKICKEIIDSHDDAKAISMYKILYNYNNSIKELGSFKHKAARKFFDKIPAEYVDYPISADVEALDEEITKLQVAYEILDNITAFMDTKDYKAAKQEIDIIDSDILSPDDKVLLEGYKQEILDNTQAETESEKTDEDSENDDAEGKNSDTKKKNTLSKDSVTLSMHEAENLIHGYFDALVKSTQNGNFDVVAPYMHPDSKLYSKQKKQVNQYINQGTTIGIDSIILESVNKQGANKWSVSVRNGETLYHTNGIKQQNVYTRTYTVEYVDSSFYITDLK